MKSIIGRYEMTKYDDRVEFRFPISEEDKFEKKHIITIYSILGLITIGLMLPFILTKNYFHAVLFFVTIGLGGWYLCANFIKRAEMRYYNLVVDAQGIYETWRYPDKTISKSVPWEEMQYCSIFPYVVSISTRPPKSYDAIVFSTKSLDDRVVRKTIRKTWKSSMQYETKFRKIPNTIFVLIDSDNGETLFQILKDFKNLEDSSEGSP